MYCEPLRNVNTITDDKQEMFADVEADYIVRKRIVKVKYVVAKRRSSFV